MNKCTKCIYGEMWGELCFHSESYNHLLGHPRKKYFMRYAGPCGIEGKLFELHVKPQEKPGFFKRLFS